MCDGIVVSAYVTNKRDMAAKRRRCVIRVVKEQKEVMYGVGGWIKQWIERR